MTEYKKCNDLRSLFVTLANISKYHYGVSSFKASETEDFREEGNSKVNYPLAYLEMPISITENINTDDYTIALNILDRVSNSEDIIEKISITSKCHRIFSEIRYELAKYVEKVENVNVITLEDYENDKLVGVRAEFSVKVNKNTAKCDNVFAYPSLATFDITFDFTFG